MARLYQNYGESKEQCSNFCNRLLKIDPSNEQATFMYANLMLMDAKTGGAIDTYIQLLTDMCISKFYLNDESGKLFLK
jgi:cytochrome c-type biogenesis protein CcmH/NrfG